MRVAVWTRLPCPCVLCALSFTLSKRFHAATFIHSLFYHCTHTLTSRYRAIFGRRYIIFRIQTGNYINMINGFHRLLFAVTYSIQPIVLLFVQLLFFHSVYLFFFSLGYSPFPFMDTYTNIPESKLTE